MASITPAQMRRAALQRAAIPRPFWPLGCLGIVVDAWPDAFADVGAGWLVNQWRAGGVRGVMFEAFGGRILMPQPGDPVAVEVNGDLVAGLALPYGTIVQTSGGVIPVASPIVAAWPALRGVANG